MKMYCVVFGDVIDSRALEPSLRVAATTVIEKILDSLNERYRAHIVSDFGIVQGDGFEGVLDTSADITSLVQELIRRLDTALGIRVRISVVIGELTIVSSDRNKSDGPAFYRAVAEIDRLREQKSDHWFQVSIITGTDSQPLVDGLLTTLTVLTECWTDKQREVVWAMMQANDSMHKAAEQLAISPSDVRERLQTANYNVYVEAWQALGEYLVALSKETVADEDNTNFIEDNNMELTPEAILQMVFQIEHQLTGAWERDSAEAQQFAFYDKGVHDMAARIAELMIFRL